MMKREKFVFLQFFEDERREWIGGNLLKIEHNMHANLSGYGDLRIRGIFAYRFERRFGSMRDIRDRSGLSRG